MSPAAPISSLPVGRAPGMQRLFAAAFCLSGFAALAYQIAWQRVLTQFIGSDAISAVLVVAIFMIWLGIGAEIARRLLPRIGQRAGVAYAVLETIVGIAGLVSIPVLRLGNAWFATLGFESVAADFALNLLLLAIPIIGMGMTTPLIVEVAKNELSDLGRVVGRFYGLNILGAAIGALATGLLLIELFGLTGVTIFTAVINIGVGVLVLAATRERTVDSPSVMAAAKAEPASNIPARLPPAMLVAAVLFGFSTLALQIVFFRVLSNYFTLSTIVFPIVLCAYLLLMAAGQFVGGRLADRFNDRLPVVLCGLVAAGSIALLAALRFPPSWAAPGGALRFTDFNGQLVRDQYPGLVGDPSLLPSLLFSLAFMAAVLPWAALFPVLLRWMTRSIGEASDRFAALYTSYTMGNVVGVVVSGLILFERVGTGGTAIFAILMACAGGLIVHLRDAPRRMVALGALAAAFMAAAMVPLNYYERFQLARYRISDVFEGQTGVATVVETGRFYTIIDINRTASASALAREPGPNDSYEAWRWNHTELMALDPGFRPRNILIIGLGHAYLIDALLDLPFVQKITVVELSREIADAVKAHTLTTTSRIFSDPRVDIVIADGRRFVQKALARGETYDLIQNKINEPWHAGSGNLFTVEFFRTQRRLLAPNGYLGVRPLAGHLIDGLKVFDDAVWPGYYHMFFKNGALPDMAVARITPDIRAAWTQLIPGRANSSGPRVQTLSVVKLPCCGFGNGVRHNTDDHPTFEYYWLSRTFGTWTSPRTQLWDLTLPARSVRVVLD
jgi:spermidine synthase